MASNSCNLNFIVVGRILFDDGIVAIDQEVHEDVEGQAEAVWGREQNAARNLQQWKGKAAKVTFDLLTDPRKKRNWRNFLDVVGLRLG
jgi:hypothetical protein